MIKACSVLLPLFIFGIFNTFSQPVFNIQEVEKQWPESNIALADWVELNVFLKKGKLDINMYEKKQTYIIDFKGVSKISGSISYFPIFFVPENVKGYTYVPNGSSFKKLPIVELEDYSDVSDDIFYSDSREKRFKYQGVVKGSVVEQTHNYKFLNEGFIPANFFLSGVPTLISEYKVNFDSKIDLAYYIHGDTTGLNFQEIKKGNITTWIWKMEQKPSTTKPKRSASRRYVDPHVMVYIKTHPITQKPYLGNVDALFNFNQEFLKEINPGNLDSDLKELVDSMKNVHTNKMELAKNLYYWVQNETRYIAFEDGLGGFVPRNVNDVYRKKYGDCKDLSNLLTEMCKYAGLDAHLAWIGTRTLPYKYSEIGLPAVDNHMISVLNSDTGWVFMDGTSEFLSFGMPSGFIQGKEALIYLGKDKYKVAEVPIMSPDASISKEKLELKIDSNLKTIVSGNVTFTGYIKFNIVSNLLSEKDEDKVLFLNNLVNKGINNAVVSDLKYSNPNRDSLFKIDYSMEIPGIVKTNGNKLIINMQLGKAYSDYKVDIKDHGKLPVEFYFPFLDEFEYQLTIPQGYKVSYIPDNVTFKNPNFSVDFTYKQVGNKIILNKTLRLSSIQINPNDFEIWNNMIDQISVAYKESIVLEKNN